MSEEEKKAIEDSKELINELEKHKDKDFIGRLYYKNKPIEETLMLLLNIVEKQQKEIDYLQTKTKRNENIEKIKMCMTHNMPNNAEIVCMVREDFERNFGNDYISKDKIREIISKYINVQEHFKYTNQELYGEELRNMIKELLEV